MRHPVSLPGDVTVWMNVSSSAAWKRPPVGIVRVERALARELAALFEPGRFRLCVWQDDGFAEHLAGDGSDEAAAGPAVDLTLARPPSFDLVRPFVLRALQRVHPDTGEDAPSSSAAAVVTEPVHRPRRGDFLISAGLDWEQRYTERLHDLARSRGLRIITCCYDLIPVLFPQYCVGEVARRFTEYFAWLCWGSEAVLCISRQSERDFLALCRRLGAPERPTQVIPLGDNVPVGHGEVGDEVLGLTRRPFILFVSTIERRKNHEVLYRAYHRLARQGLADRLPRLVFVGMPGWGTAELMKDIELDPLTQGLIAQLHHASDAELNHLYRHAAFCVYPSLYEGWGLPVGEALAMGKAVIASAEGSLPEVGGDLVRYVDPWDTAGWAQAIWDWAGNPAAVRRQEAEVRRRYTVRHWSGTAQVVAELIAERCKLPQASELAWQPGYDLATDCGLTVGPYIEATGRAGCLLRGPGWPLRSGPYTLELTVRCDGPVAEPVELSVRSRQGQLQHAHRSTQVGGTGGAAEAVSLPFRLDGDVDDIELRCEVGDGSTLVVERVRVTVSAAAPDAS